MAQNEISTTGLPVEFDGTILRISIKDRDALIKEKRDPVASDYQFELLNASAQASRLAETISRVTSIRIVFTPDDAPRVTMAFGGG